MKIDKFTDAYIEAALWSSTDGDGDPLDSHYTVGNFAPETLAEMIADCATFQASNAVDIAAGTDDYNYTRDERAGHDFWLTRNGHGAGFWDGAYNKEVGKRLTNASHAYGEVNLYIQDGCVHAD